MYGCMQRQTLLNKKITVNLYDEAVFGIGWGGAMGHNTVQLEMAHKQRNCYIGQ